MQTNEEVSNLGGFLLDVCGRLLSIVMTLEDITTTSKKHTTGNEGYKKGLELPDSQVQSYPGYPNTFGQRGFIGCSDK